VQRACPVCLQSRPRPFCVHKGVAFVRCADCRSLYYATPPDFEKINRIYQEDYQNVRGHSGNDAIEECKRATIRAYLSILERHGPPGRRLVEVGCSAGAGLAEAAETGWQAEGIEISIASAKIARGRSGVVAIHTGTVKDAPIEDDEIDVFALFDVIEHIDPPGETIATLYRRLKPGGLLMLVTPDAGSISARLMRAHWPHLFVEHVVLFSRKGIRRLLKSHGFQVERIGFAWKRINLDMLVRHAAIHRHVAFGRILRLLGRALPRPFLRARFPFNIGEFYVLARRPTR
jgi:SAM-dependent methyltransferase